MHDLLFGATIGLHSAVFAQDQLAATGGQSLGMVGWIAAGLVVVGAAIVLIAVLRRRKGAGAPPSEPMNDDESA